MAVYFDDLFDGGGFEEGGGDALFDAEDDAVGGSYLLHRHVSWLSEVGVWRAPYPYGGRTKFDGFEGVLYLEEAAFGGEGAVGRCQRGLGREARVEYAYLIPRSGWSY